MIKEILEKSKRDRTILGIWTYDDEDAFWSGRVKDFDENFVQIEHFTKYGKPDGIILEQISNIQSIDFNDGYSEAMEFLVENHHLLDLKEEIKIEIPKTENWQFEILKSYVGNRNVIVRIQLQDDNIYSGFVNNCDEESIVINCVGSEGHDEFFSLYKNEDIKMVRVNDLDARKRLLLFNWRKEKS